MYSVVEGSSSQHDSATGLELQIYPKLSQNHKAKEDFHENSTKLIHIEEEQQPRAVNYIGEKGQVR